MEDWLNRIGLSLQFMSAFLVTPQIVGEDAMRRLAGHVSAASLRVRARLRQSRLFLGVVAVGNLYFWAVVAAGVLQALVAPIFGLRLPPWVFHAFALAFLPVGIGVIAFAFLVLPALFLSTISGYERRLLVAGGVLFTIGFLLLMWATWHPGRVIDG